MDDTAPYAWLAKFLVYGLGQLAIGLVVVLGLRPRDGVAAAASGLERAWLARVARSVSFLLVAAMGFRLWAQTASAFGTADAWSIENLWLVGAESRWGAGWRWQAGAACGMAVAALFVTRQQLAFGVFALFAAGLAVATPLVGHAAGSNGRYVLHLTHYLGAALWLGTLGVFTLAAWREAPRTPASGAVIPPRAFSPLALASAALVAASGMAVTALYLGDVSNLWTMPYGRTLAVKMMLVIAIAACGWTNWRALRAGRPPHSRVLSAEWALAVAALYATGVLTETERP